MIAAVVVLIFLLHLLFILLKKSLFRCSNVPPGPNAWQVWSNISEIGKQPHVAFKNLSALYGPLLSFRLGTQLVVVASSPETAEKILKTHDRICSGRYMPLAYYEIPRVMKSSLTMSKECNETWKLLRGITHNTLFSSRAVDLRCEIRRQKVAEMMGYLLHKQGQVVNMDNVVKITVSNIVSGVLASRNLFNVRGLDVGDKEDQRVKGLLDEIVVKAAVPGFGDLFPLLKSLDFCSKRNGIDLYRKSKSVWEEIIKERRNLRNGNDNNGVSWGQSFIDVLIDNSFLDDEIGILLTELLIAGTDSTIITIIWLVVELLKNQEILSRVRDEIATTIERNSIIESRLSECQYFQACMKETLRLHIPGPFLLPHRAIRDCNVNSYDIPKDSMILVNAWAIQVDSNNWEDASVFKPERFLESKIDFKGSHFEFIPFSAGQRMCPGFNMGFRNIQLIVACLVHHFDWSLPDCGDPKSLDTGERFGTTLKRDQTLHLIARVRSEQYVVG
ncbi:putative (S)-N-methylcoclaurine 3'-hydroxylase isozyme 2 [Primulina tabacum]|uniref:putative (S)-N-methylcoclaurine 3'-hydroxylase isozyme 2 n=1 Tax=Primulina tabacum TaxID=48773 RepID=UPI003F5A374B